MDPIKSDQSWWYHVLQQQLDSFNPKKNLYLFFLRYKQYWERGKSSGVWVNALNYLSYKSLQIKKIISKNIKATMEPELFIEDKNN